MRKVLSFVLVLALVLSSFSMVFAADSAAKSGLSDIEGITNEQAILVNYNLGIVEGNPDGTFLPEKAVTRAEFAAMLTRALNIPASALAGYTSSSFNDTAGYGWAVPYLAFCESKGIMLGDGAGNAMPGRTINTNEAVTMALRAVGYTANSSILVGVWPSNYVTLAQTEGLFDDVVTTTDGVDRANAAQIIYNLLTVGLVQVASDGTTNSLGKSETEDGVTTFVATTLLTANLSATSAKEVVGYESDSLITTIDHLGEYAWVFRNADDEILAIGDIVSTAITGTADITVSEDDEEADEKTTMAALKAEKFDGNDGVTYTVSNNVKLSGNEYVNADLGGTVLYNEDNTITLNVKTQGKSIVEIYSAVQWDADEDSKITADEISDITSDQKLMGKDFATTKNDEIILESFQLAGVKSLSDIKEDNVVYVYADDDEIRKVAVGTETVEGLVTKMAGKEGEVEATIDGKAYEFAVNKNNGMVDNACAEDDFEAGDTVKVFLDANGDIYDYDKTAGSADTYAVVVNYGGDDDGMVDETETVKIQLLVADGSVKTYTVDMDDIENRDQLKALLEEGTVNETAGVTVGSIIKYSLDKNGEINDIATTAALQIDSDKKLSSDGYYAGVEVKTDTLYFTADVADFNAMGSEGWTKKDNYDAVSFDGLKGSEFRSYYVLDSKGRIDAMLADAEATGGDDIYGVVIDKSTGTDSDGDKVYRITALVDGEEVTYDVTSDKVWTNLDYDTLYRFDFNASNEVKEPKFSIGMTAESIPEDDKNGHEGSEIGKVTPAKDEVTLNGNIIKFTTGTPKDSITVAKNAPVYIYDDDDGVFEAKKLNDVKNYFNKADNGERTVLFFVTDDEDTTVPNIVVVF